MLILLHFVRSQVFLDEPSSGMDAASKRFLWAVTEDYHSHPPVHTSHSHLVRSQVLLDEPSSGMDAASKRFLWAAIKRRTARSCTVLTTHSMEECEALCGRIGVMVDGQLCCVGPIQTLKSKYGQGYKLDVRLDPDRPVSPEAVLALLQQRFVGAQIEEFEPPNLSLTVPQAGLALSTLFRHLVELRATLPVQEASVTQCTLEQIFLILAAKAALRASTSNNG